MTHGFTLFCRTKCPITNSKNSNPHLSMVNPPGKPSQPALSELTWPLPRVNGVCLICWFQISKSMMGGYNQPQTTLIQDLIDGFSPPEKEH